MPEVPIPPPKIKAAKKMRDLMTTYYLEALSAAQNHRLVAWITSGGPVEPLVAWISFRCIPKITEP